MRVIFVDSIPAGYRLPFFQKLARLYDVEFLFTHAEKVALPENLKGQAIPNYLEAAIRRILKAIGRSASPYSHFGIALGLVPVLSKKDFDLIIAGDTSSLQQLVETFICLSIARARRKPFILYYGGWGGWRRRVVRRIVVSLLRYIMRRSSAIVTYGTRSRDFLVSLGADSDKVFMAFNTSLISDAVDGKQVSSLRQQLDIGSKKVVLFVGRLTKNKNPYLLITAFSQINRDDVRLIMIGDGECRNELQALCRKLGIEDRVSFLGAIKNEVLPHYYVLCDVLVLPSSYEPWGLVLNEAMSFGKPVIATTGVGAADDLIKNGVNGFIVPDGDAQALCGAMEQVLSNSELGKKMGAASKRIIEEGFTYEHMVNGFKMAIERVSAIK